MNPIGLAIIIVVISVYISRRFEVMAAITKLVGTLYEKCERSIPGSSSPRSPRSPISPTSPLIQGLEHVGSHFVSAVFSDFHSMFGKEDDLPQLPVPDLKKTMTKFLKTLPPVTLERDLKEAEQLIEQFVKPGGEGENLQEKLIERSKRADNWLSEWWDKHAYFASRDSVVINSSPGIQFPRQQFNCVIDQYRFTAKLIHSVLKFKHLVDRESIPVDYCRQEPTTMVQYSKLLSMARSPHVSVDRSTTYPNEKSRHVIVASNNHFFSLCVFQDGSNKAITEEDMIQQLETIVDISIHENEPPVGVLTTGNRRVWAQAYENLKKDHKNANNIELIESSICVICLDQAADNADSCMESVGLNQILHGGGSCSNSMNRWFDKPCQFVVNRNGINGICYEHSGAEGPPVMALCDMIIENSSFQRDAYGVVYIKNRNLRPPELLKWNHDMHLWDRIDLAKNVIDKEVENLDLKFFCFDKYGKNFPKSVRVSPDAFFQVSLQLAYWRLHGHHPPTYETASLRKFYKGRTECIRSATTQAAAFVKQMDDSNVDRTNKQALFFQAVQAHVSYTVDAMNFEAVDRHLMGLRLIAVEHRMSVPKLFDCRWYRHSSHFMLSSSQVPSKHQALLCFGPVVTDGYGLCYNPMEKQFLCAVSSFRNHPKTDSSDFGEEIRQALADIQTLLKE